MDNKEILHKHQQIVSLRQQGLSYNQISTQLGICKSTIVFHCKRFDVNKQKKEKNDIIDRVKSLVPICENYNQVCRGMGWTKATNERYRRLKQIVKENNLDITHFTTESFRETQPKKDAKETLLTRLNKGTLYATSLKERIINAQLKERKCECCGNRDWNGKPIPLQIHHRNGDRTDNRLENLQILCPNCHAQTENYCGGNQQKRQHTRKCTKCGERYIRENNINSQSLCNKCYAEYHEKYAKIDGVTNHFKETHPTKEQLIQDFKVLGSFLQLGKKYNVSDRAIRNWFNIYNIPTHSKEMKEYIKTH